MNLYNMLPTFKVVEVNNIVGLRSGHIIAQAEMHKADYLDGAQDYVQNGDILFLDADGKLKTFNNIDAKLAPNAVPVLHYTEELLTGFATELKYFAVEWNGLDVCYPRGLVLALGDTFTTDNFEGTFAGATVAYIGANGKITVAANLTGIGTYNGPVWNVVESDTPAVDADAVELTYLGIFDLA